MWFYLRSRLIEHDTRRSFFSVRNNHDSFRSGLLHRGGSHCLMRMPPRIGGSTTSGSRPIRAVIPSCGASSSRRSSPSWKSAGSSAVRAAVRTERVRTAVLYYERDQEDEVIRCTYEASDCVADAMRHMLRSAAGCRWAIDHWEKLKKKLTDDGTWYGIDRVYAIQLQGVSACPDELFSSEEAYTTWLDCLVAQPKPKQEDIDLILDRRRVPKSMQDRDLKLWPGNPAESRARLQAIVDRELPRLKALEETLRVQYEEPARAAAKDLALARDHEGGDGAAACRTDARAVVCPGREDPSKGPQADRAGGAGGAGDRGAGYVDRGSWEGTRRPRPSVGRRLSHAPRAGW